MYEINLDVNKHANRGVGKTTALVGLAKELISKGMDVVIVCHNNQAATLVNRNHRVPATSLKEITFGRYLVKRGAVTLYEQECIASLDTIYGETIEALCKENDELRSRLGIR